MARTAQGAGRTAAAVTRYKQKGYRAGYAGHEPAAGTTNPSLLDAYRKAYRAGERAWADDYAAETDDWIEAHS